jgi:hypothetical protein
MPGAVSWCYRILRPGKASEKTPRGVIQRVCLKFRRTPQKNKKNTLKVAENAPKNANLSNFCSYQKANIVLNALNALNGQNYFLTG